MDQTLIDFMNRADFDELSVWLSTEERGQRWQAVAQTVTEESGGELELDATHSSAVVRATAFSGRSAVDALLAAVARHKVMEGGNG